MANENAGSERRGREQASCSRFMGFIENMDCSENGRRPDRKPKIFSRWRRLKTGSTLRQCCLQSLHGIQSKARHEYDEYRADSGA